MGFLDDLEPDAPKPPPQTAAPATPAEPVPSGFLEGLEHAEKNNPAPEAKVPSWSEVPAKALVNAPKSAWEFGKNMVHPIMHPVDTLEGIGGLALGLMQKAGLYGGDNFKKNPDAVGKMVMDRYGSVDNFKKTLASDPVGVLGDASMLLTGGGSAAARAPGILGKAGEAARTVGNVIDPLNAVTLPVKAAVGTLNHTAGMTTGAGHRALEEAAGAGWEGGAGAKAFKDNMRGNAPLERVVEEARSALDQMRHERGNDYKAGMSGVAINQAPVPLSAWQDIYNSVHQAEAIKKFKGQELDPATAAVRNDLRKTITDWTALPARDFHTAEGLDALKRKIGNTRDQHQPGTPERAVADIYYNSVRKAIQDHVPEYGRIMEGYGKASDTLREIEKTLSLPRNERKGSIDTSLRKLQSALRNNVNTNFGQRERMVEYLERNGSPHLMKSLAGQALNTWTPRGLSRLAAMLGLESAAHGGSLIPALLQIMPPRLMGEVYYGIGTAGRLSGLKAISPAINKPVARTLQQTGRWVPTENNARGGAVDRALRATKR